MGDERAMTKAGANRAADGSGSLYASDSGISGVRYGVADVGGGRILAIESSAPLHILNSSVWNGGFAKVTSIVNRQVDRSYDCADPAAEMKRFLQRSGFEPERTAAMLTAANIRGYGRKLAAAEGGPAVCAWVTAGLSNRSRAGSLRASDKLYPGTINTIVVIDGGLTEAALVNAVITATEAKAAALQDMGVLTDDGLQATGTTTDAVIIAAVPRGGPIRYAGPATTAGAAIGAAVYEATRASLRGDLGGR